MQISINILEKYSHSSVCPFYTFKTFQVGRFWPAGLMFDNPALNWLSSQSNITFHFQNWCFSKVSERIVTLEPEIHLWVLFFFIGSVQNYYSNDTLVPLPAEWLVYTPRWPLQLRWLASFKCGESECLNERRAIRGRHRWTQYCSDCKHLCLF